MPKQVKLMDEMPLAKPQELKTKPVTLEVIGKLPKQFLESKFLYAEPKLDGLRGIAIVRKGKCKLYTSGGVRVVNGPKIIAALEFAAVADRELLDDRVWDGEFFTDDWNVTASLVKTQSKHPDRNKLCFRVFDALSLHEWKKQLGTSPLFHRKTIVTALHSVVGGKQSSAVTRMPCDTFQAQTKKFAEKVLLKAIEGFFQRCVKAGHEGAVIKDPNAVYGFKKSKDWLKLKPYYESDLEVVGVKEGTGRNVGRLGAFICRGRVDGKKIKTQVGGGLTDELRDKFWKQHTKGKLIGTIIEVKHEGLTAKKAVRFPRFYRVRSDRTKPN